MHVSRDRRCPYCLSRNVNRARVAQGLLIRHYECRACQRKFSGLRSPLARISWGERRY